MAERVLKAAYKVRGPFTEPVTYNKCTMDKETKSLQQEVVTEDKEVFFVHFPMGHSIRVGFAELKRLGYHIKPRVVDMETGDIVDAGGDPYDFGNDPMRDVDVNLLADKDTTPKAAKPKSAEV